jgi:HK97 family phage prohead protease
MFVRRAPLATSTSRTTARPTVVYRGAEDFLTLVRGGTAAPVMRGEFAVFNQWTTISSVFEGTFLERIAPGAFARTFRNDRSSMRVLFQHGGDPYIGNKPLGPIDQLRETNSGAFYEVPLIDAPYVRELLPGLDAGLYGASFRFRVLREDIVESPGVSAYNPQGIPERTIREAQVMEFGPVTFPAYSGASAGLRSLTDEFQGLKRGVVPRPNISPASEAIRDVRWRKRHTRKVDLWFVR